MTIGVGVQGDNWAVLAADSLLRYDKLGLRYNKIQRWGAGLYAMEAGLGQIGPHPLRAPDIEPGEFTVSSEMERVQKVYELIDGVHRKFVRPDTPDEGQHPCALILNARPAPTIFRGTGRGIIERAEPGQTFILRETKTHEAASQAAGEVEAVYWLWGMLQQEGVREWADFPITCLSVGPDGERYRRYERETFSQLQGGAAT